MRTLVLASGGVLGISYLGVFKALQEREIYLSEFQAIYGTSIGAIIGLLICLGYSLQAIDYLIMNIPSNSLFDITAKSILSFPETLGLDDGSRLKHILSQAILKKTNFNPNQLTFKTLYSIIPKMFTVNSVDIKNQEHFIMNHINTPNMLIIDAVLASSSIPYIFSPI